MIRTVAQGCLAIILLSSNASAFVTPGGLPLGLGHKSVSHLGDARRRAPARASNLPAVTCQYGRQKAMDDDDSKLSRRKLVQGAAALATFLATGAAPKASQAAYVANEGSRVRGTVLQGDPFNGALRYSDFMPKLYNLCRNLGFAPGNILPSRAFCSDENQIYAVMQLTKHFGIPPFDHGRVGGTVATDRHGPHAGHGKDLLLVQASHVGYEGDANWGKYRRLATPDKHISTSCGMIAGTLAWYTKQYEDACDRIRVLRVGGEPRIRIPIYILDNDKKEGIYLNLGKLVRMDDRGGYIPVGRSSTWQEFPMSRELESKIGSKIAMTPQSISSDVIALGGFDDLDSNPLGGFLTADDFYFKKTVLDRGEPGYFLERHMLANMQEILTSPAPYLTAALCNSQMEFERTARTLIKNPLYKGKKVLFVSGVNVDVSPSQYAVGMMGDTIFLPVAGMMMDDNGKVFNLQQKALASALAKQPAENPQAMDLEEAVKLIARSNNAPTLMVGASCGCPSCACSASDGAPQTQLAQR